jgi:hypothetical protein
VTVSRIAYATREQVKRACSINGPAEDARVDRVICAESQKMESDSRTWFIPRFATLEIPIHTSLYSARAPFRIVLPGHLWSLTSIVLQSTGNPDVTLTAADYRFLKPGPPYDTIELWPDRPYDVVINTTYGYTPTSTVLVTGVWTRANQTVAGGALVGAINDAVTNLVCSDASLVGVGDSLLLGSEQILVTNRALVETDAALAEGLDADLSQTAVRINDGDLVLPGETMTVDGERMYVEGVSGDTVICQRQFDGSVLAAHSAAAIISVPRSLTVARHQGGTDAASHADDAPILVYQPPDDVRNAVLAKSIATIQQEMAGYGRVVGTGDGARPYSGKQVLDEWACVTRFYRRAWSVV